MAIDPREGLSLTIPGLSSWRLYDAKYLDVPLLVYAIRTAWNEIPGDLFLSAQWDRADVLYNEAGGKIAMVVPRRHRAKRIPRSPAQCVTKILCGCGCGESFSPSRPWNRFLNNRHRQHAFRSRGNAFPREVGQS